MEPPERYDRDCMNKNEVSRELQLKVLVVGEYGVGKTAVIRRYTQGEFSLNYKVTIGVDFAVKSMDWDSRTKLNLQLWDIAGHERFGSLTRIYYKYALAAIVVFDLSRPESLQSVVKWVKDVREKAVLFDSKKIPVILFANKCDVEGIAINTGVISKFCAQHEIDMWFLTSAKEDTNINEAMKWIIRRVLELRAAPPSPLPSIILTSEDPIPEESSSCCR